MGDRGQVKIIQWDEKPVYLYSHYDGYRMDEIVENVLKRRKRWDDGPYLSRMIFCEMVKDDVGGELGYGISSSECDHYVSVNIHIKNETIEIVKYGETTFSGSFEEFLER